jgi:magnesium transporter
MMLIFSNRIGILLAVGSGVLIGSSFVFKKKGLLSSQKGKVAGEGVGYLKSVSSHA